MTRTRLAHDVRRALVTARAEADRRGDRRLGTEHLLLGLLEDPSGPCAQALGADRSEARTALADLDVEALASVGIEVPGPSPADPTRRRRRRARFSAGARHALARSVARRGRGAEISTADVLAAVLDADGPDPALAVVRRLGRDPQAVRDRLEGS